MDAAGEREISDGEARDITAGDLVAAYASGIFPMSDSAEDEEVFWVDPEVRGIIPLDGFRIPDSLAKAMKRAPFTVTADKAFYDVIDACAARTPVRGETWINPKIRGWFCELHDAGLAHSVECWDKDGRLAGGLYGLALNGAFFGESMFSRVTNASKIALVHLVERLRAGGFTLLDCQFVNPHLVQFGCIEIAREDYQSMLESALSRSSASFEKGSAPGSETVSVSGAVSAAAASSSA